MIVAELMARLATMPPTGRVTIVIERGEIAPDDAGGLCVWARTVTYGHNFHNEVGIVGHAGFDGPEPVPE